MNQITSTSDLPMATINNQGLRISLQRFRVLIMGRANAGKTTILQKVCNTTDNPEIYGTEGNKIDAAVVTSSIKRGNHDIAHEMVFKSDPRFVFHDSCGFEAGSEEEFENMKRFITERGNTKELEERIHAIWYCIPMDDPWRTFQRAEEKFFVECDTGNVPVVVVFTKFEALRPIAYGKIKKELKALSAEERSKRIAQGAEQEFTDTGVLDRLWDAKNRARPKSYVRLENMNKPDTNCNILLEHTTLALDNEELQLCLISTQQSNLELCIKCAVQTLVDCSHSLLQYQLNLYDIVKWFPHLDLSIDNRCYLGTAVIVYNLMASIEKDAIISILQPLVAKGLLLTTANNMIQTGIATIIVLEYSAFLPHEYGDTAYVKSAVDYYLQSPMAVAVEKGVKEISHQGYKKEELEKKIVEFILEHRMCTSLASV
ncbi:hypothetical protein BDR04DRAFT_1104873 [Suillus decipiens]|nr:hypothetical protein BDR04DRAFT_1104873 [Suillus decipiens]